MKKLLLTLSMMGALLLTMGVGSSRAKDCQDLLVGNRYRCQFNEENAGLIETCLQALSPGFSPPSSI